MSAIERIEKKARALSNEPPSVVIYKNAFNEWYCTISPTLELGVLKLDAYGCKPGLAESLEELESKMDRELEKQLLEAQKSVAALEVVLDRK